MRKALDQAMKLQLAEQRAYTTILEKASKQEIKVARRADVSRRREMQMAAKAGLRRDRSPSETPRRQPTLAEALHHKPPAPNTAPNNVRRTRQRKVQKTKMRQLTIAEALTKSATRSLNKQATTNLSYTTRPTQSQDEALTRDSDHGTREEERERTTEEEQGRTTHRNPKTAQGKKTTREEHERGADEPDGEPHPPPARRRRTDE
jgi:hypothetical protein